MCRLLFLRRGACRKATILQPWLDKLIESQGGDGNGYATINNGVVKGVDLSASACAAAMCGQLRKSNVLWHTRAISCGQKCDDLCHPFPTGKGFLAHNGHWPLGAFSSHLLNGDWSDSKVAALYIRLYDWTSFCNYATGGVWLHLVKGGVQVHYASGSLYVELETGSLCSEPCPVWGEWRRATPGSYDVDEEVDYEVPKGPTRVVEWETGLRRLSFDWRETLKIRS